MRLYKGKRHRFSVSAGRVRKVIMDIRWDAYTEGSAPIMDRTFLLMFTLLTMRFTLEYNRRLTQEEVEQETGITYRSVA